MKSIRKHCPTQAGASKMAGVSMMEMLVAMAATGGLLIASYQVNQSIQTGIIDSDRRINTMVQTSHLLDRMDTAIRSSSLMLSPLRTYDPDALILRDRVDNDQDGMIDEMDEAFPGSERLVSGVAARGIWFQRVLDIDDRTVPPRVIYERPSYLYFRKPPINPKAEDLRLEDKAGVVVLSVGNDDVIIARNVLEFSVTLNAGSLDIAMTVLRRKVDGEMTRHSYTRKIRPKNR